MARSWSRCTGSQPALHCTHIVLNLSYDCDSCVLCYIFRVLICFYVFFSLTYIRKHPNNSLRTYLYWFYSCYALDRQIVCYRIRLCTNCERHNCRKCIAHSSSSSSSSDESDLGGAVTLLLQDHRTTNKSVCKQPKHSKQFMQWSVTVCYQTAGNDDRNKDDFNSRRKAGREAAFRTCRGSAFHAAVTGNERSPRVERRVDGTSRVDV